MELNQTQKQTQTVTPQMMQFFTILQMGMQDLREYIGEILLENPVLETAEPEERPDRSGELDQRALDWLASNDRQNIYYYTQDVEGARGDALSNVGCFLDEDNDLKRYILSQFMGTDLEPEVMRGVEFLVDRLDSNGFLDEPLEVLAREAGLSMAVLRRALVELQAADPAGVGAQDLSECLRLQIERRAGNHELAVRIVECGLDYLARNQYAALCRELGGTEKDVREACALVRTLNPRPGTGFAARENLVYLTPDVTVAASRDHFELLVNDAALPRLRLSSYYSGLLRETGDQEVRQYLTEKVEQARWVVKSLDQRRSTLLRCTQWVVEHQKEFFRFGPGHLQAAAMSDAARELDLHESTISRTLKDKYLQSDWGMYPLSYFFSRPLGPDGVAPEAAKALLRQLVKEEDKPLSDQRLCEEMTRRGCALSRRTVAKYREELGIPNAAGRQLSQGRKSGPKEA